jgi:hypothetical protein
MKKISFILFGVICWHVYLSASPNTLYEQLCEINAEWKKYYSVAYKMGYTNAHIITDEQDLLVFHIRAVENIFSQRITDHLSETQKTNRQKNLSLLREYSKLRNCPRNYYLPYRNPVFIDHEGRYCAVGYLLLKSGKQEFCETVQKTNNFIFIRQIELPEFHQWQQESGLSIDELAWIQPGYDPYTKFVEYNQFKADGKTVEADKNISKRYYNVEKDTTNLMGVIFFSLPVDYKYSLKKSGYKGKKPNWSKIDSATRILAVAAFKNEVYISTHYMNYIYTQVQGNDTVIIEQKSAIMKYNAQKDEWETLLDLKGKHKAYKLKIFNDKLLAYGGSNEYNPKKKGDVKIEYESFLAEFDGKTWNIDKNNYHSIIFMVLGEQGKINYLGTVVNRLDYYDVEKGDTYEIDY